jgi:organic radical activating enzyme
LSKIKIAELFYSIQGEGRYMGVPSVFLRTFGCNFKCEGFGMKPGQKTEEYLNVNPEDYKTYNELPLVSTGCDSYASWDPRFKHLSPVLSSDSIAEAIVDTLPYKEWNDEHLVITGGEPLLGWQRAYPDLLNHPKMAGLKEITFETNGTQELTPEFRRYLLDWTLNPRGEVGGARGKDALTFSVSAKLPCSGESWEDAIKPAVILQYQEVGTVYLKFVIATREDAKDARRAAAEYYAEGFTGHVYLMPVGGVESVYEMNKRQVAEEAMMQGWRYSDRLQVPLFKNEWGT